MAARGSSVWNGIWAISACFNVVLAAVAIAFFGRRTLVFDGDIKASDLIVIVLAAVTVVLAALALVIAGLAVWGYAEIKRAAEAAATEAAKETAESVARDVAVSAATRTAYAERALQNGSESPISGESGFGLDALSAALVSDQG